MLPFKCLEAGSLKQHLCADAAYAEHESEGLQIGMPAVSWTVSLVFESTQQPGPCMGVNGREDELCGTRVAQTHNSSKRRGIFFFPETETIFLANIYLSRQRSSLMNVN